MDWFFHIFSLLCAYVNCDFVLILILYCVILILILYCFIPLEMHVRLICAIKFYLLTYLLTKLLVSDYGLRFGLSGR